jgi:integrase/recombinase XerD
MAYKMRRGGWGPDGQTTDHLSEEIIPPPALVRAGLESLPAIIRAQGERASHRSIEFFTATIRNRNTRMAYPRAVKRFFDWCDEHHLGLEDIEPIRHLCIYRGAGRRNCQDERQTAPGRDPPVVRVSGHGRRSGVHCGRFRARPQLLVTRGKTPVLSGAEMRQLLKSIDPANS